MQGKLFTLGSQAGIATGEERPPQLLSHVEFPRRHGSEQSKIYRSQKPPAAAARRGSQEDLLTILIHWDEELMFEKIIKF